MWEPLADEIGEAAREVFSHSFRVCGALRILRGRRRDGRLNQIKGARRAKRSSHRAHAREREGNRDMRLSLFLASLHTLSTICELRARRDL